MDGCQRPAVTRLLCAGHYDQWRRHGEEGLGILHDKQRLSESRRAYWSGMSPNERARRVAAMQRANKSYDRDEKWSMEASLARRTKLAEGWRPAFADKVCKGCGRAYSPSSGRQVYCTKACADLCRRARSYGLTNDELLDLIDRQNGVCALCARPEAGFFRGQPLVVDHCHATGRVRGLLCGDCNTAIGRFGDDPARLRAAAAYLER